MVVFQQLLYKKFQGIVFTGNYIIYSSRTSVGGWACKFGDYGWGKGLRRQRNTGAGAYRACRDMVVSGELFLALEILL